MALITSTQSGNFNDTATWTVGVVPTAGDEARAANGHTITITADVTCDEVSNEGTGIFTLNSGVTLTANVTNKSTTNNRNCLQFTAASPATATIIGNCTGGTVLGARAVEVTSTGALTITGNCTGGSGSGGSITGGSYGVWITTAGSVTITGNCTGGSGQWAIGAASNGAGTITITGNCTGGAGASAFGAINNAAGTLSITGNCTCASTTAVAGALNNSTGTMIVTGSVFASEFGAGVSGSNRGQVTRLTGPFYTSPTFGVNPIGCVAWRWDTALSNTTFIEVPTQNLAATRNLVTPDNATNFPSASNVRSGTTYGISGALTGTCAVPPAASVATGVPVDNTVGTAALAPADFWNALTSDMNTSGSIGARLKNAATVDTTGQALADALSPN